MTRPRTQISRLLLIFVVSMSCTSGSASRRELSGVGEKGGNHEETASIRFTRQLENCVTNAEKQLPDCPKGSMYGPCLSMYGKYSKTFCRTFCKIDKMVGIMSEFGNCNEQVQYPTKLDCTYDLKVDDSPEEKLNLINEYIDCLVAWLQTAPSPRIGWQLAEKTGELQFTIFMISNFFSRTEKK